MFVCPCVCMSACVCESVCVSVCFWVFERNSFLLDSALHKVNGSKYETFFQVLRNVCLISDLKR